MKPPCPDCHRIHAATDTHALRRSEPTLAHRHAQSPRNIHKSLSITVEMKLAKRK